MEIKEIESAIEGILFAAGDPVGVERLCMALDLDRATVDNVCQRLADYYSYERRGVRLLRLENSYQLCSAPEHADCIRRAFESRRPARLSQPALEVLAIIAYYQPTTRAYVDQIRGVDSAYTVGLLLERDLIEECGRLAVPGRPILYRTTQTFLRSFGLSSLEELPELPSASPEDGQITMEMQANLERLKAEQELRESRERLEGLCAQLSQVRQKAAEGLAERIKKSLLELNFLDVEFEIAFRRLEKYTAHGFDDVEFLISTNPGESVKPLGMVASGGELSRIMLAIKTVLADTDDVPTLIFDEIDTGISGRTAQKVSEQLAVISGSRQVICITHLPQIASMADCHFEMAKEPKDAKTVTTIRRLDGEQQIVELARLLGGVEITGAVLQNAREMKELAEETKSRVRE